MLTRQTNSRTIPLIWAASALIAALLLALSFRPNSGADLYDSYDVFAHLHYALSVVAILIIFAGIYWVLGFAPRGYRRGLAYSHLALTVVGVLLVFAPQLRFNLDDPQAAFAVRNTVSAVGYIMTLLGLTAFAVLLVFMVLDHRSVVKRP